MHLQMIDLHFQGRQRVHCTRTLARVEGELIKLGDSELVNFLWEENKNKFIKGPEGPLSERKGPRAP